tara:strand:- start:421 stop:1194 length:774 start_codon:yes stop_codon:yes gene_type:complete
MCDCGCNTCETKSTALVLNESVAPKTILSEGLKYHIDNNKPLTEHLYRAGSRAYFDLFAEARSLYSRGILEFTHEDDLALLKETHLGHFGILNDERVPLDFPIEIDEAYEVNGKRIPADLTIAGKKVKAIYHNDSKNIEDHEIEYEDGTKEPYLKHIIKEAAKKKKGPKLNKPMRSSSGGKAYKVYVKDPKTGNIKTVRFGSGGLRAKINDRKARQAFAKRHKCSTRNDKTKASYWSCRLPRYAKLLGLKSSFSGFW